MKAKQAIQDYIWLTMIWLVVSVVLRITEWVMVGDSHIVDGLACAELKGVGFDLLTVLTVSTLCFIPYVLIGRFARKTASAIAIVLSVLLLTIHFCFTVYFKYELKPVDIFVFGYSLNELLFTIQTANVNVGLAALCPLLLAVVITMGFVALRRIELRKVMVRLFMCVLVVGTVAHFVIGGKAYEWSDSEMEYYLKVNKSSFFYENYLRHILLNRDAEDVSMSVYMSKLFPNKHFTDEEYPLLSATDFNDAIGNYFNVGEEKPNIVIIISEGLATKFIGEYKGAAFMPFLTSLSDRSLYWDNCLSTGERSHVAAPSILASTPYGEKGFALESGMPRHFSFVNLLKGYYSSFYYGQGAWFDNKDNFLKNDGIDRIIDKDRYPATYDKVMVDGYFWGYRDKDLFKHSLNCIDTLNKKPRLDIYFTGTMHPPFSVDDELRYDRKIDSITQRLPDDKRRFVEKYREYLRTLLYTDDAYRDFFAQYAKRDDFKNTIFVITGDHPMSQLPFENSMERFHVPLFIYSQMLKQGKTFHAVNSHFDILPTFVAFLKNKYDMDMPDRNGFMGKVVDTAFEVRCKVPIIQMNPNGQCVDMMYKNLFIANDRDLYKVGDKLRVEKVDNSSLKNELSSLLYSFSNMRIDVCKNDRIIPDTLFLKSTKARVLANVKMDSIIMEPNSEYFSLHESNCRIPNGRYFFELEGEIVNSNPTPQSVPLVVIDIRDKDGSPLYWNSFCPTDKLPLRLSFDVNAKQSPTLKLFFWNKDKSVFKLKNCAWRVYTQATE